MSGGTLVVGASQAGAEIAITLRQLGDTEPITVVGAEAVPPYERPPLSKSFLAGAVELPSFSLRTSHFYDERDINVVGGHTVTTIELDGKAGGSGVAHTDDGRVHPFDRLALAVGARSRRLNVPGAELEGVCYLRTIVDATRLRHQLAAALHVVVIGGGFIGLEVASVARSMGKAVTVVEAADRLMSRSVAPIVSEFYRDAHVRRGVEFCLGAAVVALEGVQGRIAGVQLTDGRRLPADVVVVGVGIVPRTELAMQLGLRCDGGIVVDRHGRTSNRAIVAAGDCTVSPDPLTGTGHHRLESVPNAIAQARAAAASLLGRPGPPPEVPWFWSDQYDLKLQIAGLADGYDQCIVREMGEDAMSALYYRGGSLIAVNAVNRVADYFDVRRALSRGATVPPHQAGNPDVRLATVTVQRVEAERSRAGTEMRDNLDSVAME